MPLGRFAIQQEKQCKLVFKGQKLEICIHSQLRNNFGLVLFSPVNESRVVWTFDLPMPLTAPPKSSQNQLFHTFDASLQKELLNHIILSDLFILKPIKEIHSHWDTLSKLAGSCMCSLNTLLQCSEHNLCSH